MTLLTTATIQDAIFTLSALIDTGNVPPENVPVESGFRKYVFKLPTRPNEENLCVEINLWEMSITDDNSHTTPWAELEKTKSGVYVAKKTSQASSFRTPRYWYAVNHMVIGKGHILPYDSHQPIVIHAPLSMQVSQTVKDKVVIDESRHIYADDGKTKRHELQLNHLNNESDYEVDIVATLEIGYGAEREISVQGVFNKEPRGYYSLYSGYMTSQTAPCDRNRSTSASRWKNTARLKLSNGTLPYDSAASIVIYAQKNISIEYKVRPKQTN